jgi:hypothetical protein
MTASYVTPPQLAEDYRVDPSKVLVWIKTGELRAFNVATSTTGRPRFRIPLDAIVEFEARRSARVPVKATKRKKKKKDDSFVTYF